MIKKLLITAVLATFAVSAHAQTTDKQKIIDHLKYFSDDPNESVLSSDGKRRYQKEYSINKDGGVDVRIREKYLPAVTDGKNYTPKSSYFSFSPKTMRYMGKFAKGANVVGIASLMVDILGEGVDWALDPVNNTVQINNSLYYNWEVTNYLGSYQVSNTAQAKTVAEAFFKKVYGEQSNYVVHGCNFDSNQDISCTYNDNRSIAFYKSVAATQVMSEQELDTIIKDLAKSGNIHAKQVILDAGKDEIAEGKHDDDITRLADDITSGNAQDDPQPDPDNPPKEGTDTPTDGDTTSDPTPPDDTGQGDKKDDNEQADEVRQDRTFELPPFCSWATIVCDFIGTKPDMPDEPMPTKDIALKNPSEFDKDYVNFNAQCPADINVEIDLVFAKHTISYSFTPICDFVENYLSIVIIFGAYLFATLHISSAFKI